MPFCQWNPVNNEPRVSHPTWNNRTIAHVVTSNESDEQIGEARWSVSAISPIALGTELQCSVVLAQRTSYSLKITMNRRCHRTHVNFSQSLAHFRLTIDEFFNLLARDVIVTSIIQFFAIYSCHYRSIVYRQVSLKFTRDTLPRLSAINFSKFTRDK